MIGSNTETLAPAIERDTSQVVDATIQKCSQIATLPSVAAQIIRLSEDPDSTIEDLNAVIVNDPVLGIRILKLVNSAYYGMPGQIHSIKRAIVMLGLKAVKNIAIAASLVNMVRGGRVCSTFNAADLWDHSVAVATGAQLLAHKSTLVPMDEAFLAGLIHDIGIVLEMQAFGPQFADMIQILSSEETLTFRNAEIEAFGASHEEFGTGLCKAWNFPRILQSVTGYHHRPWELDESERLLPTLIHIADVLVARINLGYTRTVETHAIDAELLAATNITEDDLESTAQSMPEAMRESQRLLSNDH